MYRLIASDLDGTLLDDWGQMPEVNTEYIRKAADIGVNVALCSGRSYVSLARYEQMLGLNKQGCYGICFNGGIVYDAFNKTILSDIRMDRAIALDLIDKAMAAIDAPGIGMGVYAGERLYTIGVDERISEYATRSRIEFTAVGHFSEITENPTKIIIRGDHATLRRVHARMQTYIDGRCRMFFTLHDLLELIPPDSGKGQGLRILAEKLGVPISETIAIGDQVNDIDMIEAAGLGVAVANAVDEVKAAADYVAQADNNAGVFKEIAEKFLAL